MKSEKAKELIEKYAVSNSRDAAPSMLKKTCILCVELAEQEAEERMREKAQKAFCYNCSALCFKPQECNLRQSFIQKLNEE